MATRETYTITESTAYIILTWSGGDVRHIPKRNLTIVQKPNKHGAYKVYLNWPSGDYPNALDNIYLDYTEVSSPTYASNAALVAALTEMVDAAVGSSSAGGAGGGSIVYTNAAGDFVATANNGTKTITITGLPFTLEAKHVVGGSIKKINANDEVSNVKLTDVSVAAGVITLTDEADNFVTADTLYVTLIGPDKWYDRAQDSAKQLVQNPEWAHYTDVEHIIDDTDATVDQHYSPEIFMDGYRNLAIQLTATCTTGAAGVVFKIWGTLNTAAATPADLDAAPSADWIDLSTDILGAATVTLGTAASESLLVLIGLTFLLIFSVPQP
jgi:hypothetical protein